jgi:cytochrome subunit of sulfide dehydrogenase
MSMSTGAMADASIIAVTTTGETMSTCRMMGVALIATLYVAAPTLAAEGEILALSCAACHGTDGKSAGSIPTIAGKNRAVLETTLTDFKSGKRTGTVMNRLAKGYTDDEIKALATFFAERK